MRGWRVSLVGLMAACAQPASAQDEPAITEIGCAAVALEDGAHQVMAEPSFHVLAADAEDDGGAFTVDGDYLTVAVMCDRSSPVPAAQDYKVPDAGYRLYLRSGEEDGRIVTALDWSGEGYDFRVVDGALTEDELALAQARLEGYPLPAED
ncbi:MAG: hypothetical protein MI723_14045 [Caulobacterales bacterium]|nr:hypothetical protein [Caulobacterales bacterium]